MTRATKRLKKATRAYVQTAAVDELTAYSVKNEFSKEMATSYPQVACRETKLNFESGTSLPLAYSIKLRNDSIRNGTFPHRIVKMYNTLGTYKDEMVYETDENGIKKDKKAIEYFIPIY